MLEIDPSLTTRCFEMMQQEPRVITDVQTKAQFVERVTNHVVTDKIHDELLSCVIAHVLQGNATSSDIIIGSKLVSSIKSMRWHLSERFWMLIDNHHY